MANGNPWLPDRHDPILKTWAGKITAKEIGTITGHSERKICERIHELELPTFHPQRVGWSRRDFAMAGAAAWYDAALQIP